MTDWHDRAACVSAPAEWFFPELGEGNARARLVCAGCPVRSECLDAAIEGGERFGMWGGMSPRERTVERIRRGLGPDNDRRRTGPRPVSNLPPGTAHGTRWAYQRYGCRCDECTDVASAYSRQTRAV